MTDYLPNDSMGIQFYKHLDFTKINNTLVCYIARICIKMQIYVIILKNLNYFKYRLFLLFQLLRRHSRFLRFPPKMFYNFGHWRWAHCGSAQTIFNPFFLPATFLTSKTFQPAPVSRIQFQIRVLIPSHVIFTFASTRCSFLSLSLSLSISLSRSRSLSVYFSRMIICLGLFLSLSLSFLVKVRQVHASKSFFFFNALSHYFSSLYLSLSLLLSPL